MNAFDRRLKITLFVVLALGLAARIFLAARFYGTGDVHIWEYFTSFWTEGKSPYESAFYNYGPFWYWIISLMGALSRSTGLAFSFLIKWPLILADLAIFSAVLAGAGRLSGDRRAAVYAASVFFLNPVSVLLTGYHGSFDNLSLLFVLLGWYAFTFYSISQRTFLGALFFALGVCFKHFNVMLAPVFAFRQKGLLGKLAVLLAAPLLFGLLVLPYYLSNPAAVKEGLFGWSLHGGYWGWSGVICRSMLFFTGIDLIQKPWFKLLDHFNDFLYLAIFFASIHWARRRDLLDGILLVFLMFYALTTQIAPQYTLWIVPFAALRPNRYFIAYSVAGGAQVAAFLYCHYHWYNHVPFVGTLSNLASPAFVLMRYLTWGVCVLWFFSLARRSQTTP